MERKGREWDRSVARALSERLWYKAGRKLVKRIVLRQSIAVFLSNPVFIKKKKKTQFTAFPL